MGRRRSSKVEVSMFPFLSVLCSVIGVLMLMMIATISTRAIDAVAGRSVQDQPVPSAAEADTRNRPPPQQSLGGEGELAEEEFRRLAERIEQLSYTFTERQQQRDALQQKVLELEQLIAMKRDELELQFDEGEGTIGHVLDKPEDVEMVVDESHKVDKTPVLVEVSADRIRAHGASDFRDFPLSDLEGESTAFGRFLEDLGNRRDEQYVLLLVHPNGAAAFGDVKLKVMQSALQIGWEPFSEHWLLLKQQSAAGDEE